MKTFHRITAWLLCLWLAVPLLAGCVSTSAPPPAEAESRLALVIGNAKYRTLTPLDNPVNDATAIAEMLRRQLGFEVMLHTDVTKKDFTSAVQTFKERLARSPGQVGLVFYTGHGMRGPDANNYMLPIDADPGSQQDLQWQAQPVERLLEEMVAARPRISLLIIDACRETSQLTSQTEGTAAPGMGGKTSWLTSRTKGPSTPGMQSMQAPSGSLIAFAAAPNTVALDSVKDGDRPSPHSPYVTALLKQLPRRDLTIEQMFKEVRKDVLAMTRGGQTPWENSSLLSEFYFVPPSASSPAQAVTNPASVVEISNSLPSTASSPTSASTWVTARWTSSNSLPGTASPPAPPVTNSASKVEVFNYFPSTAPSPTPPVTASLPAPTGRPAENSVPNTVSSLQLPNRDRVPDTPQMQEKPTKQRRQPALPGEAALQTANQLRNKGDLPGARSWYQQAAAAGNPIAQSQLGEMYAKGQGVAKDDAAAAQWYRKAAEQGFVVAQNNLGAMYKEGQGVAKDDAAAVQWFRKAAEQGAAEAQYNLGVMYQQGRGVAKDDAAAVQWYRKAAEQGYADSQFNLGVMYAKGQGVAKDDAAAVQWYFKAAEQRHAKAQTNLGTMYTLGQGVAKDDVAAVQWFRKAAEQGNAVAQTKLGLMYALGHGVAKDDAAAVQWFRKAAEQGLEEAKVLLQKAQGGGVECWLC